MISIKHGKANAASGEETLAYRKMGIYIRDVGVLVLFETDHPGGEGAGEYACHLYELLSLERGHEAVEAMDYGASGGGVDHVDRAVQG